MTQEESKIDRLIAERYGKIAGRLMEAAKKGHLCVREEEEIEGCIVLNGTEARFEGAIGRWEDLYYFQKNWVLEGEVVRHFLELMGKVSFTPIKEKGKLNPKQLEAVIIGLSQKVVCLTGGPGTGKSFVIHEIVQRFSGRVCVCAPTGKAVSLLREKLPCDVGTLHHVLGIKSGKDLIFLQKKLPYDMVIVDECSMIDVALWAALLRNLRKEARLILVGDPHQLPPVEAGPIFGELCRFMKKKKQGFVELTTCMRSDRADIFEMSVAAKEGGCIPYKPLEKKREEWKAAFKKGGFRLLSCLRKGLFGVDAINALMSGEEEMPILITRTDKRLGLNNGDMGVLIKRGLGPQLGKNDVAIFGEREFPALLLPPFELAYCLSVHKSQGSEFDRVTLLVPKGSEVFGREVLYTAITRARKEMEVLADSEAIAGCLQNSEKKRSGIEKKLALFA